MTHEQCFFLENPSGAIQKLQLKYTNKTMETLFPYGHKFGEITEIRHLHSSLLQDSETIYAKRKLLSKVRFDQFQLLR